MISLEWRSHDPASTLPIIPFICSSLQHLSIAGFFRAAYKEAGAKATNDVLQNLVHRTQELEVFQLESWFPVTHINMALAAYLKSSPKLQEVGLPPFHQTTEVVEALSGLSNLEALDADFIDGSSHYTAEAMNFRFLEDGFPVLRDLTREAPSLTSMKQALLPPSRYFQLSYLHISCSKYSRSPGFDALLDALTNCCHDLTELTFKLFSEAGEAVGPLTADCIKKLYVYGGLKNLGIGHNYPLALEPSQIRDTGRS